MSDVWASVFRFTVGVYWLYFASTKWQGVGWVKGVLQSADAANPIPGLHEFLVQVVSPNWFLFAIAQTIGETLVGLLLVVGIATRWAGVIGLLLAVGLALVVAFSVHDDGFRWLYYLAVLVNAQIIVSGRGPLALGRFSWVPEFLR